MSGSRKTKLLDPDASNAMEKLKTECAMDLGLTDYVKENNRDYKGNQTAKRNGAEGGPIGGEMVKRMIQMSKEQMK